MDLIGQRVLANQFCLDICLDVLAIVLVLGGIKM